MNAGYGTDASITQAGTLSVNGQAIGTQGGEIEITGDQILLASGSEINASGQAGGGEVLVGGDYLGANPDVQNTQDTEMQSGSKIYANATADGDGGKVILWSDKDLRFHGDIEARGGASGGNGGFVETSGAETALTYGSVLADAPLGEAGTWLTDPAIDTIDGPTAATIVASLNAGTNVTRTATDDILIQSSILVNPIAAVILSFDADRDIIHSSGNDIISTGPALTINYNADFNNDNIGGISIDDDVSLITNGGDINMTGRGYTVSGNGIDLAGFTTGILLDAGGGNINLNGIGTAALSTHGLQIYNTSMNTTTGSINLTGQGNAGGTGTNFGMLINGSDFNTTTGGITFDGDGGGTGAGDGIILENDSDITSISGNILINADAAPTSTTAGAVGLTLTGAGSQITSGGNININATGGGTGAVSHGLQVTATSTIDATGSGNITINATASPSSSSAAQGIFMSGNGTKITSVNGNINLTGNSAATGAGSIGISLQTDSLIESTGTGNITLNGNSAVTAGVQAAGGAGVTTASGTLTVNGSSTAGDDISVTGANSFIGDAFLQSGDIFLNGEQLNVTDALALISTQGNLIVTGTNSLTITQNAGFMFEVEDATFRSDGGIILNSNVQFANPFGVTGGDVSFIADADGNNVGSFIGTTHDIIANNRSVSIQAAQIAIQDIDASEVVPLGAGMINLNATAGTVIFQDLSTGAEADSGNDSGNISVTAQTGITGNTAISRSQLFTTGSTISNAGDVTLSTASGNVTMTGAIDARSQEDTSFGTPALTGNGGDVTINTGAGDVILNGIDTFVAVTMSDSDAGDAGNVTITATGGLIDIDPGGITSSSSTGVNNGTAGNGGIVQLTADTTIDVSGTIDTSSSNTGISGTGSTQNGGDINISAGGFVNTFVLRAHSETSGLGSTSGNGGSVMVDGSGVITDGIETYSASLSTTNAGDSGNAGSVDITGGSGAINVGGVIDSSSISANGGSDSGNAGDITLTTTAGGDINVSLDLIAESSVANGTGGNAGQVNINSSGNVLLNDIFTLTSSSGVGTAGIAGSVFIHTPMGTLDVTNIDAITSGFQTSGPGGDVTLISSGAVNATSITTDHAPGLVAGGDTRAGNITIQSSTAGINVGILSASALSGTAGGDAGSIVLDGLTGINTTTIDVSSMSGDSGSLNARSFAGNANLGTIDGAGSGGSVTIIANNFTQTTNFTPGTGASFTADQAGVINITPALLAGLTDFDTVTAGGGGLNTGINIAGALTPGFDLILNSTGNINIDNALTMGPHSLTLFSPGQINQTAPVTGSGFFNVLGGVANLMDPGNNLTGPMLFSLQDLSFYNTADIMTGTLGVPSIIQNISTLASLMGNIEISNLGDLSIDGPVMAAGDISISTTSGELNLIPGASMQANEVILHSDTAIINEAGQELVDDVERWLFFGPSTEDIDLGTISDPFIQEQGSFPDSIPGSENVVVTEAAPAGAESIIQDVLSEDANPLPGGDGKGGPTIEPPPPGSEQTFTPESTDDDEENTSGPPPGVDDGGEDEDDQTPQEIAPTKSEQVNDKKEDEKTVGAGELDVLGGDGGNSGPITIPRELSEALGEQAEAELRSALNDAAPEVAVTPPPAANTDDWGPSVFNNVFGPGSGFTLGGGNFDPPASLGESVGNQAQQELNNALNNAF
ncbi:MAG: hypothetical protein AAF571_01015 [Verrucomicrobiota bacterium]